MPHLHAAGQRRRLRSAMTVTVAPLEPPANSGLGPRNYSLALINVYMLKKLTQMGTSAPQAPDFAKAFAPELARRVSIVLCALFALVARRFARDPRLIMLSIPLCRRITRARLRFERLMARLAAGKLPSLRPRKPHQGGPHKPRVIPQSRWWLIRTLGWEVNGQASQLAAVLDDPEAVALLAQIPAAIRILAPIRRMLGHGATPRTLRTPPVVPQQYCALPPALDPQWGRPPECETWHRWSISPIRPSWP